MLLEWTRLQRFGTSERAGEDAGAVKDEPIKRAHSPQLAAGLASVYEISPIPYGEDSP
jgi:hypothetical protein